MLSKNTDLGVGGKIKVFTEAKFALMATEINVLHQNIIPWSPGIKSNWYLEEVYR